MDPVFMAKLEQSFQSLDWVASTEWIMRIANQQSSDLRPSFLGCK